MSAYRIQPAALEQLDAIHDYTVAQWGEEQAERYAAGMFSLFAEIARGDRYWHSLKPAYDIEGFFYQYGRHIVYWRGTLGDIDIVAVLHERMAISQRLQAAFDPDA